MSHFGSNVNAASFQSVNASIWKTNAIKLFQKLVCCSSFLCSKSWEKSVMVFCTFTSVCKQAEAYKG